MLETLPLPSISALRKLRKGNIDSMKAVKLLLETGQISKDVIMMVDEMYLQKCFQYIGGDYLGSDDEGNLFKGIVVFMIKKWQQGYHTHLYIYGDHPFIGDRAQGYSQW